MIGLFCSFLCHSITDRRKAEHGWSVTDVAIGGLTEIVVLLWSNMDNSQYRKINQHYVPQFYLRNFGNFLHTFDKKTENQFCTKPKNLAFRANFYGGEIDGLPSLENELARLESRHSASIKKLVESEDYYELDRTDRIQICEFLGLQYVRTEQHRNNIRISSDAIFNAMFEPIIPSELTITHDDSFDLGIQLSLLSDFRKYAVFFFNMKFVVLVNNTTNPFWTSDNPLTKQNEHDCAPLGTLGILNSGIEFHLPLTPSLVLWVLDPKIFDMVPNIRYASAPEIVRENFLQLEFSNRFVYSYSKKFDLINSMLKDNPHCKVEGRGRFETIVGKQNGITKVIINVERNMRWPIDPNNLVLDKMQTWAPKDFIDDVMGNAL